MSDMCHVPLPFDFVTLDKQTHDSAAGFHKAKNAPLSKSAISRQKRRNKLIMR